jgi:BMFP domain-containing protein YqiC
MAQGVRRELEQVVKGQFERWLATLDVVTREEFEAVKEMAAHARDENDKLEARLAALEAKLGGADKTA